MENRLIVRYHSVVVKLQGRGNKRAAERWSCSVEGEGRKIQADAEVAGKPKAKSTGEPDQKSCRGAGE